MTEAQPRNGLKVRQVTQLSLLVCGRFGKVEANRLWGGLTPILASTMLLL